MHFPARATCITARANPPYRWRPAIARILVIDDEPLIAMLVEGWLTELGHEPVGPATTAAAALSAIEAGGVDAAFLDLTLDNGKPSYGVADALNAGAIPFAFVTGHGKGMIEPAYSDAPVLAKPFDFDGIRTALDRLLKV